MQSENQDEYCFESSNRHRLFRSKDICLSPILSSWKVLMIRISPSYKSKQHISPHSTTCICISHWQQKPFINKILKTEMLLFSRHLPCRADTQWPRSTCPRPCLCTLRMRQNCASSACPCFLQHHLSSAGSIQPHSNITTGAFHIWPTISYCF